MKKSRKSLKRARQTISVDQVISNRILILAVSITVCFLIIFLRLFYLQIVSYNDYTAKREDYTSIKQYTSAPRGQIYDCNICAAIAANPILDGVTLSGGDPLLQPEAMAAFLRLLKERTGQNVWCYTGYTLEECLADPARRECLRWIDTLVDGRYVEALRDLSLDFRGSSNQRIIDVGALHLFG